MAKVYTLSEVAEHNTAEDCWIVVDGKVYDVTRYLEDHPGGDEVILFATGKDATTDFNDVGHTKDARTMMSQYEVGEIEAPTIPTKLKSVDSASEPQYNPDQTSQFVVRVLQILVPLAVLAIAVASRYLTKK